MYQQGALAYQQTTKTVETPRERESALLMKAAARMQRIREEWPNSIDDLAPCLTFNRKLWTIFMTAVTRDDSPLPADIRENVANLGIFILNETREILLDADPQPRKLETLVRINRQLAAGLRGT